ncbi:hypothetical protein C8R43DRAFT_467523 [Mycena crocata]|nr:hypothetical protein C8R43DRAFT_467523 [Mycena crocata]
MSFWRGTRRVFSVTSLKRRLFETDSCGIPLRPTWSVNDLLSSYPTPYLTPQTLEHLHDLSALIPPEEDTPEYGQLKAGLEELIRLVEAVKLIDIKNIEASGSHDPGRQTGNINPGHELFCNGRSLLKHAARTRDGFYIVDADKPQ